MLSGVNGAASVIQHRGGHTSSRQQHQNENDSSSSPSMSTSSTSSFPHHSPSSSSTIHHANGGGGYHYDNVVNSGHNTALPSPAASNFFPYSSSQTFSTGMGAPASSSASSASSIGSLSSSFGNNDNPLNLHKQSTKLMKDSNVDIESLAELAHRNVQQARQQHTDWSSVNVLLFRRSPKIQNRERYIYNAIGFCHICLKLALVSWTVYSLVFHVILVSLSGLEALLQLLLLSAILTGISVNYFMCITMDNSIPDCWVPPSELHNGGVCMFCKRTRPMRAHHCVSCGCCQLRRDHHSHWIGNCVGYFNYPFFVSLALYDCMFCAQTVYLTAAYAEQSMLLQEYDHPFNFIFLWGMGILCFVVVGCYFLVNVYLTLRGRTSTECVSGYYRFSQNPYDLGPIGNWQFIWGTHPFALFWPFLAPRRKKNDLIFPLVPKARDLFHHHHPSSHASGTSRTFHKSSSVYDLAGPLLPSCSPPPSASGAASDKNNHSSSPSILDKRA